MRRIMGAPEMGGRTMTGNVASTEVMTSRIPGLDLLRPKDKESTTGTMRCFEP